jgi:hypothetical protein
MISKMDERRKRKTVNTEERKNYRRLNNELRRGTDKAKLEYLESKCDEITELQRRGLLFYYYYLLTAIGLMPSGSVTKIGRTYKKWTYIARKQNIHLTKKQHVHLRYTKKKQHISQNFTIQYKCNEQNTRYNK